MVEIKTLDGMITVVHDYFSSFNLRKLKLKNLVKHNIIS